MLGETAEHRVDHLLRAERLAAADAREDLCFVQHARRLGAGRYVELRGECDRVFRAGLRAKSALNALRFDQPKLWRERIVEDRAFRAGAHARKTHRARIAVDRDGAERCTRRQWNGLARYRRVGGEVIDRKRQRRALVGGRPKRRRDARSERGRPLPQRALERLGVAVNETEVLALVPERIGDRVADAHLECERIAILRRSRCAGQHGDRRGTPCERGQPYVEPDGCDVVNFDRQHARRQSFAAASQSRERGAIALGVEQHAGVAAARSGIRREERPHARAERRHAGIGIRHRARGANGGARAAAHAKMRLDEDVIAVCADRAGRADVDALRAAFLLCAAVCANRFFVAEEFRLLEFAFECRDFGDGLRLRHGVDSGPVVTLRRLMLSEPRLAIEVEDDVEPLALRRRCAVEIDGADRPASRHALPVIAAHLQIDLITPIDRMLRTRMDARIASRA